MAGFSQTNRASAVAACRSPCCRAKDADDAQVARTRQRARALLARPSRPPTPCQQKAAAMGGVTARFERYGDAMPSARAAQDLNELGDADAAPVTKPCLTRLPLNAAALNRALGIDPNSPGAIKPRDLRDDRTGYRAALYRDEATGRIIMVSRDTQPHSLVDWKTNIDNGRGVDTDQYKAARTLSSKLARNGVPFDVAGYSKGGGLAQEAALVSPNSKAYVFNSAGLNNASLARTGQSSFDSLERRTSSFSSQNDFLTHMNTTTDPQGELRNARFLRDQLAGPSGWGLDRLAKPMQVQYLNPADTSGDGADYQRQRATFMRELDQLIAAKERNPDGGALFPPVRAGTHDTIPNSTTWVNRRLGANDPGPNLGKLAQHQITNVVGPMEKQMDADREAMRDFRRSCG